jgi:3'-phosphoadenosine 5'-phosphosulfate sulfotransferase (PAPS reductase)/FAD synthetase
MSKCNIVSISGGKDSTATALLAIDNEVENLRFVFADTGHEHDITYQHIDYLNDKFKELCGIGIDCVKADFSEKIKAKRQGLIDHIITMSECGKSNKRLKSYTPEIVERMVDNLEPTGNSFADLAIWKGRFPSTRARFCSEELKHRPLNDYINSFVGEFNAIISWQGVRRDESEERSTLNEKDVEFGSWEPEPFGHLIYRPILDWKAQDTFDFADRFGVNPNPLYKMGMGRVGCMPCIHATKHEVRSIERYLPDVIDKMVDMESRVSESCKRGCSTFMDARVTAKYLGTGKTIDDIKISTHGFKTYVDYARTERGGRQQSLIAAIDLTSEKTCSSIYGLCE